MKGLYPAVFSYDEQYQCYYVNFPDVKGCYTYGETLYEAFENAEDVINLMLSTYEEMNDDEPVSLSKLSELELKPGETAYLIRVNTEGYRKYQNIIRYLELQREIVSNPEMIPVPLS